MNITLEKVQVEEIEVCNDILKQGKAFQQAQGFTQWTDEYPNRETIRADIEQGKGYALKIDGRIAGYMCVDFGGEPAYEAIDGAWGTAEPYAVVHRMAFSGEFRGMGLADRAFALIRVDTDFPNERMQHILKKNGFEHRGVIVFQGSGKLAYDKTLGTRMIVEKP